MKKYFRTYITIIALAACSLFMTPAALADKGRRSKSATQSTGLHHQGKDRFHAEDRLWQFMETSCAAKHGSARGHQGIRGAGQLSWTDSKGRHDLPVQVHLRGNTSQVESQCPFPKMTLSFEKIGTGTGFQRGRYSTA